MVKIISASLLSADFSVLADEIRRAHKAGVEWIHLDVMDGVFVPNISFGIPIIESIRPVTGLPFDTHLMINEPERYIKEFKDAGSDIITVHAESCQDLPGAIRKIRGADANPGVSIKPSTPLDAVEGVLGDVSVLLIMGVEPGFGGQKYDKAVTAKIASARKIIDERGLKTLIEVDGGVNDETAAEISRAGCDIFVAGSYLFKHPAGIREAVSELRRQIQRI